jgi:hypothetical protein
VVISNAWDKDQEVVLNLKKEEVVEDKTKNFQDGDYQWADEPDEVFFTEKEVKKSINGDQVKVGNVTQNDYFAEKKEQVEVKEEKEFKLSEKEMIEILKRRHKEEIIKTRKLLLQNGVKPKPKEVNQQFTFDMSDKYLKKQIFLNKDIFLYEKKWLFDREFKFFFSSIYYQNILATDLRWREDYQHILFIRLMSYHNIGITKSFLTFSLQDLP